MNNHDLEYVALHVYVVTYTLPVESVLGGSGVQCSLGVPFADSNLIALLVYIVIFWSFPFFFPGVKTECFRGEVGSAAALWCSFVCSVFRDGLVYECLLVVFLCYFSCVFCCSLIWVMLGKRHGLACRGELGMEYIQISIACLHIPIYIILPTIVMLKSEISRLLIGLDVSEMTPGPNPRRVKVATPISTQKNPLNFDLQPLDLLFFY